MQPLTAQAPQMITNPPVQAYQSIGVVSPPPAKTQSEVINPITPEMQLKRPVENVGVLNQGYQSIGAVSPPAGVQKKNTKADKFEKKKPLDTAILPGFEPKKPAKSAQIFKAIHYVIISVASIVTISTVVGLLKKK